MTKLVSLAVTLVLIVAVAAAGYEAYLKKPSKSALSEPIVIANGMTTEEIAAVLKKSGIISSSAIFTVVADVSGRFKDFHAGTFVFKEGMSALDALKTLSFKGQQEISVTIPEGYDLRQIAERLAASGVIAKTDDFYAVTGQPAATDNALAPELIKEYPFLAAKPARVSLEGYLFPDTYRFYAADDPTTVVEKMLDNYREKMKVSGEYPDFETLVLASLVESEVKTAADRAKVADIIGRRLAADMPLQFDSTVNYVTGKSSPSVSLADLSVDSPWNTYKHAGLPPGPICSPGLDSIKAALAPTPNKYLYFLTTPDGTVIYSRTLDEHNDAKAKYLK